MRLERLSAYLKDRIYICHTYYHVYVACLKELTKKAGSGSAELVLSRMSTDFTGLKERAESSGIFDAVWEFDEKDYTAFPELLPLKEDTGSLAGNLKNRLRFQKRLGELQEPFVPVDLTQYRDIYVFCDSDPIGYYLFTKKIRYHAVEDGLNCLCYRDTAREDNAGHFGLKAFLARIGVLFIQNGYSRFCIDMEVNDLSALDHPIPKMKEVPREEMVRALTKEDERRLVKLFIANEEELEKSLAAAAGENRPLVLILTEPLCKDLAVRRQLFEDMIHTYGQIGGRQGTIVIKPHPRDLLDYRQAFPQHVVLDARFPMEILNFTGALFDRVVTVYTVPSSIRCAREKVYLGSDFMDRYEDKNAHAHVTNAVYTVEKDGGAGAAEEIKHV